MVFESTGGAGFTERRSVAPLPAVRWAVSACSASLKYLRGGDVFEAVGCRDGGTSVLIADLCSKGALAEVHTDALRRAFRRCVDDRMRPARVLTFLNRLTLEVPAPPTDVVFASAVVATFHPGTRNMTYASAGHESALVISQGGVHRHLRTTAPLLGIFEDVHVTEREESLKADDLFVLVTDGVTECRSAREKGRQFGTHGVVRAVASALVRGPDGAHDALRRNLDHFSGGFYRDDATIAVLAAS